MYNLKTKKIELVRYNQKTRVDELYPKLAKAFLHEVYISLSTSSLATITCVSLAYQWRAQQGLVHFTELQSMCHANGPSQLQHTSLDPSMTFNIVSNVFRIPMAVTAFSSLSSPSNSWTKVPACVNKLVIITNFICTKTWRTNFELYYSGGNSKMCIFWDIFHRLCHGSSHIKKLFLIHCLLQYKPHHYNIKWC